MSTEHSRSRVEDIRDMSGILERALNEALFHQAENKTLKEKMQEDTAKLDEAQLKLDMTRKELTDARAKIEELTGMVADMRAEQDQAIPPQGGNGIAHDETKLSG